MISTYHILITGTVQGVGFRPFVYALAMRYLLTGRVSNNAQGVEIITNADPLTFKQFLTALEYKSPPLATIESIIHKKIDYRAFDSFEIIETKEHGEVVVNIPPDLSICKACEEELFDSTNRRFGYAFITCTHCGVRYSIINDLPYDRKNTSMAEFKMCKACYEEYTNPLDRRYHAQPIGCFECGPKLVLKNKKASLAIEQSKIVEKTAQLLKEGNIVAIKGVGGYHLMCDASNQEAIKKLRERKRRPTKPFAVMVKDIVSAKALAYINKDEERLLASQERPIVLLRAKAYKNANIIAPNINRIGLFLPYTPLHLLLLDKLGSTLIATSANLSDEPIATDRKSIERLEGIYDYLLDHNRKILNGCDDSVVMVVENQTIMLRRARGYTPVSVELPFSLSKKTLALGANQKSTVALGFENKAILSPHIGDLGGIASVEYFKKNIENLKRIYRFTPELLVHDKHPNYESTKYAKNASLARNEVQHHHAHILALMAEKKIDSKVFGVAFDGTGYGEDGKLWGGEFMVCDYEGFERVAHLNYFKLLGGAKAIREPRRVALSLLFEEYGKEAVNLDNPTVISFGRSELQTYYVAWEKGLNAPLSSSMGRLFDAVASLLGVCHIMSFEGESGMLLEELYDSSISGVYTFGYEEGRIDVLPMIREILKEENTAVAVSRFFNTLIEMITVVYEGYHDLPLVCSGGVFQNRVLLKLLLNRFPNALLPNAFPPNDGGIALGQLMAGSRT